MSRPSTFWGRVAIARLFRRPPPPGATIVAVAKDSKEPKDSKAKQTKSVNPAEVLRQLKATGEIRHETVAPVGLEPRLALLRAWQAGRLAKTYADLMADKRTRPAGEFFLSDIY